MSLRPQTLNWERIRDILASLVIVGMVLFAITSAERTAGDARPDIETLLAWGVALAVFVLVDLLAVGIWAGLLNALVLTIWLSQGIGAAMLLVLTGALLAFGLRRLLSSLLSFAYHEQLSTGVGSHALRRAGINGLPLSVAALIYSALGGAVPLTSANAEPLALMLVILLAFVVAQAAGLLMTSAPRATRAGWQAGERHRLLGEALVWVLIPALVLIYQGGALTFSVLVVLLGVQVVQRRQMQVSRAQLAQCDRELSMLNNVGQRMSGSVALDDVIESIYESAVEGLHADLFYVALYDEARERFSFPLVLEDQTRVTWQDGATDSEPLAAFVLANGQAVSLDAHDRLPSDMSNPIPDGKRYVGVPLTDGESVYGVIGIMMDARQNASEGMTLRTLETLAHQVSVAIRDATLYGRSYQVAQSLALINRSVQDIMFNLDTNNALRFACQTALQIVQADKVALFLFDDPGNKQGRLADSLGLNEEHERLYVNPAYQPHLDSTAQRARTRIDPDDPADETLATLARVGDFRALAEMPLKSGNIPVGVLVVFHDVPHVYYETELELLETLAYQVAAALENAELLGALELYAGEQAQLVHLSRISTSSLDVQTVVAGISELLTKMLEVVWVSIGMLPQGANYLQLYRANGTGRMALPLEDMPEIQSAFNQQQPQPLVYSWQQADGLSARLRDWLAEEALSSLVLMPMIADNRVLGVAMLGTDVHYTFGERELRLFEMAANQVAAQLHNAQTYEKTQKALDRRLQQLALIEDIAQQISSALNLDRVIHNVLEAALRATGSQLATVGLLTETNDLRVIMLESINNQFQTYEMRRSAKPGLLGHVVTTGRMLIIPDHGATEHTLIYPEERTYASSLAVPMLRDQQTVGALMLASVKPDHFDEEQAAFVKNLAGHALISLENARLLEQRQAQIDTLIKLRDLSLRLSSNTPQETVVESILRTTLELLHAQDAALYQHHPDDGTFTLLKNLRDYGGSVESTTRLVLPEAVLQRAITTGEIQTTQDVWRSDHFISFVDAEGIDYISLAAAPIKRNATVSAVLCVTYAAGRPYREADSNTIGLLAIQAAGHLENMLLYQRIRAQKDRMQAILDSTRDGILLLDREGRLIEANASAESLLNINLQDYINRNFVESLVADLGASSEEEDMNLLESLREMLRVLRLEPERITTNNIEIHVGSDKRYIHQVGSPVLDSHMNPMGRLLTLRDMTEEKMLEAYRDEISKMVVHDLRGPLGSIQTSLTLFKERANEIGDETMNDSIDVSIYSAEKLLNLVNSLLDIAKLETRRMPINQEPNDLKAIIDDAYRTLLISVQEAGITVKKDIPAEIPTVSVDEGKIRRVLINLLDNAIRFTPQDEDVLISVVLKGNKAYVSIADSGPGIPPEESQRVFEKFRQVNSETNTRQRGEKGSGLGLTFCKLAVEAHDETIWVEPNGPLPGACFVFTLPLSTSG